MVAASATPCVGLLLIRRLVLSWILSGIAVQSSHGGIPKQEVSNYIVILDAGSTGTRAYAFHYDSRVIYTRGKHRAFLAGKPLSIPEVQFFIDRSPGVSSYSRDPDGLRKYLKQLCSDVGARLKEEAKYKEHVKLKEVPIYLGATAGMRDLPLEERKHTFVNIRKALRDTEFAYENDVQARVLSGEEESAFDWLTENHKKGGINRESRHSYGAIDMGGESAEIVFIPQDPSIMAGLFPMHFGDFPGTLHLYTHSYMHYGQVAAYQRASRSLLAGLPQGKAPVMNACLPTGLRWWTNVDTMGVATSGESVTANASINLHGNGNFEKCVELANTILYQEPCSQSPCAFLGVYQPSLEGVNFYLTGQFTDVWKMLGLLDDVPTEGPLTFSVDRPPLIRLRETATKFCALSFADQAKFLETSKVSTANQALVCWLSAWSYTLLTKGFGFAEDSLALQVDARPKTDWAIGAAIYHVNFYPYKVQTKKRHKHHKLPSLLAEAPSDAEELDHDELPPLAPLLAAAACGALAAVLALGVVSPLCRKRSHKNPLEAHMLEN